MFANISDHEFRFDRMTGCGNGCSVSPWSQLQILPNGAYALSGPFHGTSSLTSSHVHFVGSLRSSRKLPVKLNCHFIVDQGVYYLTLVLFQYFLIFSIAILVRLVCCVTVIIWSFYFCSPFRLIEYNWLQVESVLRYTKSWIGRLG